MNRSKVLAALALFATMALVLLGLFFLLPKPAPEAPVVANKELRQVLSPTPSQPTEPENTIPPPERAPIALHTTAVGHSLTAQRLGLVATRCWVGTEFDSDDLVGRFHQRIENGWYSHVENELEGSRGVERRFRLDPDKPASMWNTGFETIFMVRWKADAPGDTVECEVEWPRYAELTVTVVDEEGGLIEGANLIACGGDGKTDARGQLTMQVFAGRGPCAVRGNVLEDPILRGRLEVPELAEHESRTVRLELSVDGPDTYEEDSERIAQALKGDLVPKVEGDLDQATLFDELAASAQGTEAKLYTHLAKHRRRVAASKVESEERMDALDDMLERMKERAKAGEPIDPDAVQSDLDEILGDLLPPKN